jgi:hypothetical protein
MSAHPIHRRHRLTIAGASLLAAAAALLHAPAGAQEGKSQPKKQVDRKARTSPVGYSNTPVLPGQKWKVHDIDRPRPRVITPATASSQERPGTPPSDAVVLFDGKDLSQWKGGRRGGPPGEPGWKVENGYMEVAFGEQGPLESKEKFGDAQYHIEWMSDPDAEGSSQWRANSGVLIMGRYEIQVLDCYNNPTYADGQAAAIYGQYPPLVNACRKPGEWQSYDIVFIAPRFENGKLIKPARVTVFHNGVLVHHDQEIIGPMAHQVIRQYEPHGPEEPLALQNHDARVRYRNIWVRRLKGYDQ